MSLEAEHLQRAQDLCRELAATIGEHVSACEARGQPSRNALALLTLAAVVAGDFDNSITAALVELDQIEGAADLRSRAAAEIRRAAYAAPCNAYSTYEGTAALLDPLHTAALVRLIHGAKPRRDDASLECVGEAERRSG